MFKKIMYLATLLLMIVGSLGINLQMVSAEDVPSSTYGADAVAVAAHYATGFNTTDKALTIQQIISVGVQALLSLLSIFFFALMLYAGLRWMTARGKEKNVEQATNTLEAAVIGLI